MASYDCNSDSVVVGTGQKGKSLFAAKNIKASDAIFQESPLVCAQFLWNAEYKYSACEHCLRPLDNAELTCRRLTEYPSLCLPYPDCYRADDIKRYTCPQCSAEYCSKECLSEATMKYHTQLCVGNWQVAVGCVSKPEHPVTILENFWKEMHHPPETCSIMLLAKMLTTFRGESDLKEDSGQGLEDFCKGLRNNEEGIAHKLLGDAYQENLEKLHGLLQRAVGDDSCKSVFEDFQSFLTFFTVVARNAQGIGTSSLAEYIKNVEKLKLPAPQRKDFDKFVDKLYEDIHDKVGGYINCEGSGLYRLQSACNHSCVPNAEVTFPNNNATLCVRALRDIPEGEEITISYLCEEDLERSRHSRHSILREQYLFTCRCAKCELQKMDPDVTSEEEEDDDDDDDEMEVS